MKDIFEKEFRSKLKVENEKIYTYIENNKLQMEKIMETYNNYISTIIRNSHINLSNEDVEEVILDVFLTLWKNQNKLDINKSMSAYISGITKNLIKYKYRQCKITQNIEEYEEKLIDNSNIEITLLQNEKQKISIKHYCINICIDFRRIFSIWILSKVRKCVRSLLPTYPMS